MTTIHETHRSPTDSAVAARRAVAGCTIAAVAAMWLGLLGPAWTYVPPQPQGTAPAAELSFAALSAAVAGSSSAVQVTYFGWLAWAFAFGTTVLAILLIRTGHRLIAALCIGAGALQLAVAVLAVKGPLPWSVFVDGLADARLGAALMLAGYVLLVAAGVLAVRLPSADHAPTPE
ncbi:hypothetical protein GCM10023094_51780 [Rhodococcus olei]|uniref:Uncharacterized protein n=1 Tax=Rhodococcus olei TaxID=2161675 RepID=A0ABP8PPI1_9NOCA